MSYETLLLKLRKTISDTNVTLWPEAMRTRSRVLHWSNVLSFETSNTRPLAIMAAFPIAMGAVYHYPRLGAKKRAVAML
jgi:hypothetical protein